MDKNTEKNTKLFEGLLLVKDSRNSENIQRVLSVLKGITLETLEKISTCMGQVFIETHWKNFRKTLTNSFDKKEKLGLATDISTGRRIQIIGGNYYKKLNPIIQCKTDNEKQLRSLLHLIAPNKEIHLTKNEIKNLIQYFQTFSQALLMYPYIFEDKKRPLAII